MGNACCATANETGESQPSTTVNAPIAQDNLVDRDNTHEPSSSVATKDDSIRPRMEKARDELFAKCGINENTYPGIQGLPLLGPYKEISGTCYAGQYKEGQKHGVGCYMWPDGNVFYGNFQNDEVHGQGTMLYQDGSTYNGEWANNKAHGEGTFKDKEGVQYTGQWSEDNR